MSHLKQKRLFLWALAYIDTSTRPNRRFFWPYFLRYFHKVPAEAPQLELKAIYGLVEPVAFELPPLSEQCTPQVYATFDLTKGAKNDKVHLQFLLFKNVWILWHDIVFNSFCCLLHRQNPKKRRWNQWRNQTWNLRKTQAASSPKHRSLFYLYYSPATVVMIAFIFSW